MKKFIAILTLLFLAHDAGAQYLGSDGYWYFDGYSQPYTRTLVQRPGYYSRGCYYPGSSYYSYSLYYPPAPVAQVIKPPVYSSTWKEEVVRYASQRDDHATYLLALKALGIQGQQYPFQQGYVSSTTYGANASTPYGYTYSSIAQLYGDTNVNQLFQQSAQLTEGAQRLAGDANNGFQQLLGQEGTNRAKVAEILAKGEAGARVLIALSPSTVAQTKTVFGTQAAAGVGVNPAGPNPAPAATEKEKKFQAFEHLVATRCASCHAGENKKGNFNITGFLGFTPEQKALVLDVITTADPARAMPRTPQGGVGVRLTPAEVELFRAH